MTALNKLFGKVVYTATVMASLSWLFLPIYAVFAITAWLNFAAGNIFAASMFALAMMLKINGEIKRYRDRWNEIPHGNWQR